MEVKLTGIEYDIFHDVIELQLNEDQEHYLPSNVYSLAESSFSTGFHPRAILLGEAVVGFLMYELGECAEDRHLCTIWRFMVDRGYQNRGVGKAAMALLMEELKANSGRKVVEVYFD